MDGLERPTVQPVQPLASDSTYLDRANLTEYSQVLGHLRLGKPEPNDAIVGTLSARGVMNVDELRRGIESMPLEAYESASYYERWLHSVETVLTEKGLLATGEIEEWVAQ